MNIPRMTIEEYLNRILTEQQELKTELKDLKRGLSKADPLGDPIIDLVELSAMLHMSKKKIYQIRMAGEIDYIQEPGSTKIFFRASAVNAYLNKYVKKAFSK